jgi:predicted nucleotidyltransferase
MGVRYRRQGRRLDRLRRELDKMLPRLVDEQTEKVILFGSTARADVGSTSDLDLLVVRHDTRPPAARVDELYQRAQPSVAVDLIVYTPEELDAAQANSGFIRRVLREGRVLYERGRALA